MICLLCDPPTEVRPPTLAALDRHHLARHPIKGGPHPTLVQKKAAEVAQAKAIRAMEDRP
jgi:hypothetical protein